MFVQLYKNSVALLFSADFTVVQKFSKSILISLYLFIVFLFFVFVLVLWGSLALGLQPSVLLMSPLINPIADAVSVVLKTHLRLTILLGPQDSEKLMYCMVHYTQEIQTEISEGKGTWDRVQEKPSLSFQVFYPNGFAWPCFILPASVCDSMYRMLSNLGSSPKP